MNLQNAKAELIGTNRKTYEGKNIQKVAFLSDEDLSEVNELLERAFFKIKELNEVFLDPSLQLKKDEKVRLTSVGLLKYGYIWPKNHFYKRMADSEFITKWSSKDNTYHYTGGNITYQINQDNNSFNIQLHNLIYNMITYDSKRKEVVLEVNPKENWDFSELYGDSKRLSYVLEVFENSLNRLEERLNDLDSANDLIEEKLEEYKSNSIKKVKNTKNTSDKPNNQAI